MRQERALDLGARQLLVSFVWVLRLHDGGTSALRDGERAGLLHPIRDEQSDWGTVQRFLVQREQPPVRRLLHLDAPLAIGRGPDRTPCTVIVGEHPAQHALSLILAADLTPAHGSLGTAEIDAAIAVLQSVHKGRPSRADEAERAVYGLQGDRRYPSVRAAALAGFGQLIDEPALDDRLARQGWCVEIRGTDGRPPGDLVADDPRPFYGLVTCDEGWRFVPPDVASSRLGESWGTRAFVAVYTLGQGVLSLNNKGDEYRSSQDRLACEHFGEVEPYFGVHSTVAGLDHGPLLSLERALTRFALAEHWLREAEQQTGPRPRSWRDHLQPLRMIYSGDSRLRRRSLNDAVGQVSSVLLAEVEPLERSLLQGLGFERLVTMLHQQVDAIDDETRYEYERSVSWLVTFLTGVTILLTAVTIVLGILQLVLQ